TPHQIGYWLVCSPRGHGGYASGYVDELEKFISSFKQTILMLRTGTAGDHIAIEYDVRDEDGNFIDDAADHEDFLMPYWTEFAAALMHWSDYYADEIYLEVHIRDIDMPKAVLDVLRPAFEQSRIESVFSSGEVITLTWRHD
ncbi:hypothetical protein THAOC_21705, partial [Thalassiosira oceanica]